MKNKKILVLNQGSTENYGDIAINDTIVTYMKDKGYQVDYFTFWLEELVLGKNYKKLPNIILKIIWHLHFLRDILMKKTIKKHIEISKYDAVIIGGGELLGGNFGFNTSLYVWTKILAKHKIPVYIIGVSGHKEMSERLLKRNKKSLHRCAKILVRDSYSYKLCKEIYDVDCDQKPDVVFAYRALCRESEKIKEKDKRNSLVCVPIMYEALKTKMNFQNKEQYFIYLYNLINKKIKIYDRIIITTTVFDDNALAEEFFLWLKKQKIQNEISFEKYTNINDYINIINKAHIVISARMHALILALIYGCDILAIPFKEKLKVFEKEYSSNMNLEEVEKRALESLDIINKELEKQDKKMEK